MKIYADNAATTKLTKTALSAMLPYLEESYGNPSSPYSFGMEAKEAIENARVKIANVLGCTPKEITFTSGGSESDNQAIISAANLGAKVGKKHIISSVFEHHAVLHTLEKLHKEGFEITLLDVSENGIISPEQVASAIRQDTCLVTIMFANNEIGTVEPIFEIGKICKEKGVLFHTDAVQAAGHLHINVAEQNIDLLSLSAHKFGGPKGAGILYAKRGVLLSNLIEGGGPE
jgi:cysteine desulfurase